MDINFWMATCAIIFIFLCLIAVAFTRAQHHHRFTRERFIRGPKGRFTSEKESYCVDCHEWIRKDG